MSSTSLDSGDHRVGAAEDEGGMRELVVRGTSGEQLDDAGKDPSPRTAVETSSVDSAFGHARGCGDSAHRGYADGELIAKSE